MNGIKYGTGGVNTSRDILRPIGGSILLSENTYVKKDLDFFKRNQLYNVWLWKKFADQFRRYGVDDWRDVRHLLGGWRGEYWGKMMRGACMVCKATGDEALYGILTDSVRDMLTAAKADGKFTTYSEAEDCKRWDLWCRKYVLLGFQYYLEICRDEVLAEQIVAAMCAHADRIIEKIGNGEGQTPINLTTSNWGGLNSSSILEPFVRLYNLTGEQRYLDFSSYIVSEGGCTDGGVFEPAYADEKAPYEYPFVKAYEMMSCFEGLLEYARVTGSEKWRDAAIRFGYKLLATDVTVIGCCGCTNELLDNSAKMQTKPDVFGDVMQETCVTVTLMKLCYQLLRITGDSVFADAIERSYYNAFVGALNTHLVTKTFTMPGKEIPAHCVFPIDSYSPLRADTRGRKVAGMCFFEEDNTNYGCCVSIASAGFGVLLESALMEQNGGYALNHYFDGAFSSGDTALRVRTGYPYSLTVTVTVEKCGAGNKALSFRIPAWSKKTAASVCGAPVSVNGGYLTVSREWKSGDTVTLCFDESTYAVLPPYSDGPDADKCIAFSRGPVMLASDARIGDAVYTPVKAVWNTDMTVTSSVVPAPKTVPDARLALCFNNADGTPVTLIDYGSAGKTQSADSTCAVWLLK